MTVRSACGPVSTSQCGFRPSRHSPRDTNGAEQGQTASDSQGHPDGGVASCLKGKVTFSDSRAAKPWSHAQRF